MSENRFKDSMNRLDYIVSQLEQNNVELEEAIQLFEEGLRLVQTCDTKLKSFEEQVSLLIKTYEGNQENEED